MEYRVLGPLEVSSGGNPLELGAGPGLATGAAAAEVAEHWVAAARPVEALEASLRAARDAEAVSGLTEALRHVERVLDLWEQVPGAEELAGIALPSLLDWAARLAGRAGSSRCSRTASRSTPIRWRGGSASARRRPPPHSRCPSATG